MKADSLVAVFTVINLSGCAVYNGVSAVVTVATGRSTVEHVISGVTGADCGMSNWLKGLDNYCELPRTAADHYVRSLDQ